MANLRSGLQLGERLGAGAFGEVFLGQDDAHGQVAVKKLVRKADWNDGKWDSWKAAFLAEAQNLSSPTIMSSKFITSSQTRMVKAY